MSLLNPHSLGSARSGPIIAAPLVLIILVLVILIVILAPLLAAFVVKNPGGRMALDPREAPVGEAGRLARQARGCSSDEFAEL